MTDTKLLTEFMEKYGKRLNDEEKTLGDEIFMWLVYKLEEAQLQAFENGSKAERERAIKALDDIYDYGMGRDEMIKKFTAALTKE